MNRIVAIALLVVVCGSVGEACQCTDIRPDHAPEFSCATQAGWGKCDKDYMQGWCNISCKRCGDTCSCVDVQPQNSTFTCEEFAGFGGCEKEWMRDGYYCAATCGYCMESSGPVSEFSEESATNVVEEAAPMKEDVQIIANTPTKPQTPNKTRQQRQAERQAAKAAQEAAEAAQEPESDVQVTTVVANTPTEAPTVEA